MKAATSVIPALWAGGKIKIPLGCWLKSSGETQSQIPIQKAYLATVLITTLVWLCLFFTLRFQNFWKYTLYFGCRICRNIQNNSWHGDDSFLLLPMCKVCVPLQPVQWLWDRCLYAPVVVPFCYLMFFFIQNVCPQCRNSTLASCSVKSHGFLVYIFYTPFVALDGSLWCCFLKGT